jgi:hypothetical protein
MKRSIKEKKNNARKKPIDYDYQNIKKKKN